MMRILRGVGSRTLPCGCLVGFYETYDGHPIAIVDARCSACSNLDHRVGAAISIDETSKIRQETDNRAPG